METLRARLKRYLGVVDLPDGLNYRCADDGCSICGADAPLHLCEHCDRACNGIGCTICAAEATRYSNL